MGPLGQVGLDINSNCRKNLLALIVTLFLCALFSSCVLSGMMPTKHIGKSTCLHINCPFWTRGHSSTKPIIFSSPLLFLPPLPFLYFVLSFCVPFLVIFSFSLIFLSLRGTCEVPRHLDLFTNLVCKCVCVCARACLTMHIVMGILFPGLCVMLVYSFIP